MRTDITPIFTRTRSLRPLCLWCPNTLVFTQPRDHTRCFARNSKKNNGDHWEMKQRWWYNRSGRNWGEVRTKFWPRQDINTYSIPTWLDANKNEALHLHSRDHIESFSWHAHCAIYNTWLAVRIIRTSLTTVPIAAPLADARADTRNIIFLHIRVIKQFESVQNSSSCRCTFFDWRAWTEAVSCTYIIIY